MNIGAICRCRFVTFDGSDSLQHAASLMREHHVGALVVTTQSKEGAQGWAC